MAFRVDSDSHPLSLNFLPPSVIYLSFLCDLTSLASFFHSFSSAQVIRDVLLLGHRQAFAWVDEWIGEFIRDDSGSCHETWVD